MDVSQHVDITVMFLHVMLVLQQSCCFFSFYIDFTVILLNLHFVHSCHVIEMFSECIIKTFFPFSFVCVPVPATLSEVSTRLVCSVQVGGSTHCKDSVVLPERQLPWQHVSEVQGPACCSGSVVFLTAVSWCRSSLPQRLRHQVVEGESVQPIIYVLNFNLIFLI